MDEKKVSRGCFPKTQILSVVLGVCLFLHLGACGVPERRQSVSGGYAPSELLPGGTGLPYKIFIASDIHVFSGGARNSDAPVFNFEADRDGKMLASGDLILAAFVNDVLEEKPDAVILSGDLTLNGERRGHEALAGALETIDRAGIRVLVIPGNHDINNPYAREMRNNRFYRAETVTPERFAQIYDDFGYAGALFRDSGSLSYIAALTSNLYTVMLDSCIYNTNIERNISASGGVLAPETLAWVDASVKSIRRQNPSARFISVIHHNLLLHHRFFDAGFFAGNSRDAVEQFGELGLKIFFSGHIHAQHIRSETVSGAFSITDIVNSSLIVNPVAYGVAELDGEGMRYYTQNVNMKRYAGRNGLTGENLSDFENYSREVFAARNRLSMLERLKESGLPDDEARAAAETVVTLNTYFFEGRVDEIAGEIKQSRGFAVITETGVMRDYVLSLLEYGAGEHNKVEISW